MPLDERTQIIVKPPPGSATLIGAAFETSKTLLLPRALDALREVFALAQRRGKCAVLVVGHTDATGEPSVNERLSLERAKSTVAWLLGDVQTWLDHYADGMPRKQRWGAHEDRLMLSALPDFGQIPRRAPDPSRTKGARFDPLTEWFQLSRGLKPDGIAGPITRKRLVTEYFALSRAARAASDDAEAETDDTSSSEPQLLPFEQEVTAHGAGENFPLARVREARAEAAAADADADAAQTTEATNPEEVPFDRRVDFFFFAEPTPTVDPKPGSPSGPEYLEWIKEATEDGLFDVGGGGRKALVVEFEDALFRTNSCVLLPQGETPIGDEDQQAVAHEATFAVGIIATALRFSDEHTEKQLFIAGHTDTTGKLEFNRTLSQERADCALAVLMGDRARFAELADARHQVGDIKQILSWATEQFATRPVAAGRLDCDPGVVDDDEGNLSTSVSAFQEQYNQSLKFFGGSAELAVDGDVGSETWGAFFDLYETSLRAEMEESADELATIRGRVRFADLDNKALGFGEHHPVQKTGRDDTRCQANRRVEALFFDPGEEPDLASARAEPDLSELYVSGEYVHRTILLDPSGGRRLTLRLFLQDFRRNLLPNTPYELRIGDQVRTALTKADGRLEERRLVVATECTVSWEHMSSLHPPSDDPSRLLAGEKVVFRYRRRFDLSFNPNVTTSDQKEAVVRLNNLGYLQREFEQNWALFERDYEIAPTIAGSQTTFERLVEVHNKGLGIGNEPAEQPASSGDASPDDFEEDDFERSSVTVTLHDDDGNPVPRQRFTLSTREGVVREGVLDDQGSATVDGLTEDDEFALSFPDLDASAWSDA